MLEGTSCGLLSTRLALKTAECGLYGAQLGISRGDVYAEVVLRLGEPLLG